MFAPVDPEGQAGQGDDAEGSGNQDQRKTAGLPSCHLRKILYI